MAKRRVRNRGPREGHCRICGEFDVLTKDHVPPQVCLDAVAMELRTLPESFDRSQGTLSQDGIYFKSLCRPCNGDRLGGQFDPHLGALCRAAATLVQSPLSFSGPIHVGPYKPARVARAIVGHVLAAYVPERMDVREAPASYIDALRRYFLDTTLPMPEGLEIYYWPYRGEKVKVIAAGGYMDVRLARQSFVFSLLKFLPLGFLLVWNRPPQLTLSRAVGCIDWSATELDVEREFVLDPRAERAPRPDWPENPEDNGIVLLHDQASLVAEKRLLRR